MTMRIPLLLASVLLLMPLPSQSQATVEDLKILRIEGTPLGALPPIALPMPASRNHNYWTFRLQTGYREGRGGSDLGAVAGGVDLQYRGGSVLGVTAGYQKRDCQVIGPGCGGHPLYGARARINLFTGGPTIGAIFGDHSATSTFGTEIGFGYATNVIEGMDACTLDFGAPFSVSMLQRIRLVAFLTPGLVWDLDCADDGPAGRATFFNGFGFGLQQLFHSGFDVNFGLQKIFRSNTGYQLGVSFTFVKLP